MSLKTKRCRRVRFAPTPGVHLVLIGLTFWHRVKVLLGWPVALRLIVTEDSPHEMNVFVEVGPRKLPQGTRHGA